MKQWKKDFFGSAPKERREMELFCYKRTIKIIKEVKPKALLIIGIRAYEELFSTELFLPLTIETIKSSMYGKSKQKIWIKMKLGKIPIFCIRHLTGSPIKETDKLEIKKKFNDFCENIQ